MRILLVTNMYPTKEMPHYGIFVSEQVQAVRRFHPDVEYEVEFVDGAASKFNYLSSIPRIVRKARSGRYDAVHVHYGIAGVFRLFAGKLPIPLVVTLHGGDIQPEQGKSVQVALTRRILRHADTVVTLNSTMDAIVSPLCSNIVQCPCSVDTDTFAPAPLALPDGNEAHIVFPSDRTRWVKNFPLFEEVLEILRTGYGIPCTFSEIKNMSRTEVRDLFLRSHMLLMTSRSEGSPQVVKEAMACNLPIVTTPVGDVEHLLAGVCQSMVGTSHNADELAAAAAAILKNRTRRSNGRERILALGLDDRSVADRVYSIYTKLIP